MSINNIHHIFPKFYSKEVEFDFKVAVKKLAEGFLNQYQEQWEQTEKKLDEVK